MYGDWFEIRHMTHTSWEWKLEPPYSHTSHLVYENRGTGAPCASRVEGEVLVYSSPGLQVYRVPVARELPCILRRQVAKNSYPTNKLLAKDANFQ